MVEKIRSLPSAALYQVCDLGKLEFKSTADLEPLAYPLGQQRALEAIEFGIDIKQPGFNLFLVGPTGLGKQELVQEVLSKRRKDADSRSDWCYVNNFSNPQKPRVLKLPPGLGQKLREDMESLVEDLLTSLPSSFQSDEYRNRLQEIEQDIQDRQEHRFRELDRKAEKEDIIIVRTPSGYTMGPVVDGKPIEQPEYEKLSDDEKQLTEQKIAEVFGICVPTAVPGAIDLKTHADRVYFVTHYACSSTWRTRIVSSENGLTILPKRPRARGRPRFIVKFLPT